MMLAEVVERRRRTQPYPEKRSTSASHWLPRKANRSVATCCMGPALSEGTVPKGGSWAEDGLRLTHGPQLSTHCLISLVMPGQK